MKPLTLQEAFNISAIHLLTQNAVAAEPGRGCQYRTASGLRCAIGAFIPWGLYDPLIEGRRAHLALDREYVGACLNIDDHVSRSTIKLAEILSEVGLTAEHRALVGALQLMHDNNPVVLWPERLQSIATTFGLEMVPMGTGEAA
jgi:hypothetical protein